MHKTIQKDTEYTFFHHQNLYNFINYFLSHERNSNLINFWEDFNKVMLLHRKNSIEVYTF